MKKNRMLAVACGTFFVVLSTAHAQTTQAPSSGANPSYSNSQGKFDPYSQGMNQDSTKSNLSPSTNSSSPMDPSAPPQGVSPQKPYPEGVKQDPQFNPGGHVYDIRNSFFMGS
jgi:hypothetical protein